MYNARLNLMVDVLNKWNSFMSKELNKRKKMSENVI